MSLFKHDTTKGEPILKGTASNVFIGKYCSISNSAIFDCGFGHHHENISCYDWRQAGVNTQYHSKTRGDIIVGNDVWIGDGVTIMSGVTIGDGAVIGTGSVVTHNITAYYIMGGIPAKKIGVRFNPADIKELLRISWWNWPIEKIKGNIELINSPNIKEFINKF